MVSLLACKRGFSGKLIQPALRKKSYYVRLGTGVYGGGFSTEEG